MKVRLLRATRIWHQAGEIVEVSPAEARFLFEVKSVEPLRAEEEKPKKTTARAKK